MRKLLASLTIILIVLFSVGCSNESVESTETKGGSENLTTTEVSSENPSESDPEIVKDSLVIATGKIDSGRFDPKQRWGTHSQHKLTHSSLLKYDSDLKLHGDLAKSYQIVDDGLTWEMILRDDVKFSNGETVTPQDVLFTFTMLKEDGAAFDLSFIEKMEVVDGNKFVIKLKKPRSTFVSQLTEIPIVPEAHYDDNYSENPIGSGPYVVKEYKEGEQVIMEANPHYEKQLQFQKITFLLLNEDAALAAAKSGGVDIVSVPPNFANIEIDNMVLKSYESIDSRGLTLPTIASGQTGKIYKAEVSVGNDVTSEKAIRQAIYHGLSRQELIDLALDGHGKPAYSICDNLPWFNEETVVKDGDIEKAKSILADAGWVDSDGDGIVEKNGKKASFKVLYNANDNLRSDLSLAVASQAKAFGIEIIAEGTNWDEIFKIGKEHAILWGGGRHHPHQLYTMNSSKEIDKGVHNMPHYKNDVVDDYLEKAMSAKDLDTAYENWKLAQWDGKEGFSGLGDAPIIWLVRVDHLYFVNSSIDLGKQPIHPHGHEWALFSNIDEWTINK